MRIMRAMRRSHRSTRLSYLEMRDYPSGEKTADFRKASVRQMFENDKNNQRLHHKRQREQTKNGKSASVKKTLRREKCGNYLSVSKKKSNVCEILERCCDDCDSEPIIREETKQPHILDASQPSRSEKDKQPCDVGFGKVIGLKQSRDPSKPSTRRRVQSEGSLDQYGSVVSEPIRCEKRIHLAAGSGVKAQPIMILRRPLVLMIFLLVAMATANSHEEKGEYNKLLQNYH